MRPSQRFEMPVYTSCLRPSLIVIALVVSFALAGQAKAQTNASQFIGQLGQQAITILQSTSGSLEQREQNFRQILAQNFDVTFIGRFVLGRSWRAATPEQQNDYLALFEDFLVLTYSRRLGGYTGERLAVVDERAAGDRDTVVRTQIDRPGGPPINADWRVRSTETGFKIIDVEVAGVSMALTQRSEFASVISRNGMNGLIEVLRARSSKLSATAARS
ncbi:MAG: ABC transporter substrate-binding protein [Alphaproteobacteria bacterium]|nr:ABC transporter substrate-binding protein [Alphaproteobacteria bacterium]